MNAPAEVPALLAALLFAACKHNGQQRKKDSGPYINHPIAVAELLARVAGVAELTILQAAFLHDVLEDTQTRPPELAERFGNEVLSIVQEVTDDMSLARPERKRLQVEKASALSRSAKLIRIADKVCNLLDITPLQPADWSTDRKREYFDWAEKVVDQCRGANVDLERHFDLILKEKRRMMS
jgi:guanosine-3',5'-bis(diphosphate) 3'-pyrophosphohydrolase